MPRWAISLVALGALAFAATRLERVVVSGESMRPTLEAGDRVLVWRTRRVVLGAFVVVPDPRDPGRPLVKRVVRVAGGTVELRGDNPGASTDSRLFGPLPRTRIEGRAVYRYHPPQRAGWLA